LKKKEKSVMRFMIIKRLTPFYLILPLMFTATGCRNNESASQRVRITPPTRTDVALGNTLLHLAPNWGVAERLIADGADVNAKDNFGMTPLHTAVRAGRTDVVGLLTANGADINAKSNAGHTPLFLAVAKGSKNIAEQLIARGAAVNTKDKFDMTPLHSAAHTGNKDMVELLIAKGANINAISIKGHTPLTLAKASGHTEITFLLRKHNAKE
jgi:ankyrin repeat protein